MITDDGDERNVEWIKDLTGMKINKEVLFVCS